MHMRNRVIYAFLLLILITAFSFRVSSAQSDSNSRTFPETGNKIEGAFLEKYNSAADPLQIYGFPFTDAFIANDESPVAGLKVQYFDKARFEFHPENAPGKQVVVSPLGRYIFELEGIDSAPVSGASNPDCLYFPETEHQTCYAFYKFFAKNGGINQLGYPISEIISYNGQLVQYFEKARLEWHPGYPSGKKVTLTNLGRIYFNIFEPKDQDLIAVPEAPVLELKVHSFPKLAVASAGDAQVIYVIVKDQLNRPVPGAQVTLTLRQSPGQSRNLGMPLTDANGVTKTAISLTDFSIGVVEVLVSVNASGEHQKDTVTSFRIWY